jgi:phage recombination protein Bet
MADKKDTKTKEPVAPAPEIKAETLTPKEQTQVRVIEKIIENREIAPADVFGKLSRPQIELIKRTVAKGATDDELRLFVQVCKGANLNPFLKQVFLVPRWDAKAGTEVKAIQVSIDGFRAIAEGSGAYAGNEDPVYDGEKEVDVPAGKSTAAKKITVPAKATVTVHKMVEGQRFAFTATARWDEYYPGQKMGFQWHIRPFLMLGKCAEALALRKAFPKLLSGMYAQEEMDKGQTELSDDQKQVKGFNALKDAIGKASKATLEEYQTKLESSDKYTDPQKLELTKMIEARLVELAPKTEKTDSKS